MVEPVYYAGVGSRKTPTAILGYMRKVATRLALRGCVLRSGGAFGADTAFEAGCFAGKGKAEIWLPWKNYGKKGDTGFYPSREHEEIAKSLHPAWDHLDKTARGLHSRNVGQVIGQDLESRVSFVVCWTPDGCETEAARSESTGGTATAIVLADVLRIPVFNLANPDAKDRLADHVLKHVPERLEAYALPVPKVNWREQR